MNKFTHLLRYQNPIILNHNEPNFANYDLRKIYQSLFDNGFVNNIRYRCCYVDKYGTNCNNNCSSYSPFVIRDYFCDIHINNRINDIIKFNKFIYSFTYIQTIIQNLLFQTVNIERGFTSLKLNLRKFIKKLFQLIQENANCLLFSEQIVNITHNIIFNSFTQHIYELNEFKIHVNFLKYFSFENIVNVNKKYRKDVIDTLVNLTNNSDNNIGKVFTNSKIGDLNIFRIIEKYI